MDCTTGQSGKWPLPLDEAKWAAIAMLRERMESEPRDWIAELNKIAAAEVDRAWLMQERQQWPRDLLGGSRRDSMQIDREQHNSILSAELFTPSTLAEPLSGDEYQLTYDAGGNVELPAFLDRQKRDISEFRDNKEAPAVGAAGPSMTREGK